MQTELKNTCLVDTNIFVYALVKEEGRKHGIASEIVEMYYSQKSFVTLQILGEVFNVIISKYKDKEILDICKEMIEQIMLIDDVNKLHYTGKTIMSATEFSIKYRKPFWDCLIAATMIENNIKVIYTENVSDYEGIPGIKAVNPF